MDKIYKKLSLHLQKNTKYDRVEWFLDPLTAANLCYRCPNTIRRWINGARIDPACYELIMLKAFGLLPLADWEGFRVTPKGLKTPSGDLIPQWYLSDVGFHYQCSKDLQSINQALLEEIRELKKARRTGQYTDKELTN